MYVELHCHSSFSLLDGASSPEALVARARALGHPALALTDHDDLGGVVRFAGAAEEAGIGGIIGAELTVGESGVGSRESGVGLEVGSRESGVGSECGSPGPHSPFPIPSHSRAARSEAASSATSPIPHSLTHLVLLAESREGYGNLSTLITRARMDSPRGHPRVSLEVLASHAGGLFALTGCPRGWVPALAAAGDLAGARAAAGTLHDIFGGRLAVECWDHGLAQERRLVPALIGIAKSLGVPWVVTNDVHYARAKGRIVHDVLCGLRHERSLDEMGTRLRPSGEWHLKSAARMRRRWRHAPEGVAATLAVAERCAFRLGELRPTLPAFPLPPGVSPDEYLERLVEQGAWERWGSGPAGTDPMTRGGAGGGTMQSGGAPRRTPAHDRQLAHELGLIRRLGLAGFFLIVWDIVRFARREGILCQGRGSAANSAVCYCLGITAVDPIRLGLLFERFLSEERREAPDIDIDFAHRDRERVLQYVYERYGREHAAMVCEQITYRGRSAVRDAARVLGFSVEQATALSLMADRFSARATAERFRGIGGASHGDAPIAGAGESNGESGAGTENDGESEGIGNGESGMGMENDGHSAGLGTGHSALGSAERRVVPPDETADAAQAAALGSRMVRGTEAATRTREEKLAARRLAQKLERTRGIEGKLRSPNERLTSADRPRPAAGYEPYGSPSAQSSGAGGLTPRPSPPAPGFTDPHAPDTHTERRNPTTALGGAADAAARDGVLARIGLDANDRRVRALAEIVEGLHDLPRHRSIHVGGFVLTAEPLSSVVPIEPASMQDRTVIQWEKDDLDPIGLVKIDLLGLGMLTVLQDCLKYIRATRGVTVDLAQLDTTDQAVYDDLCRADTIGVFQVESRAQMNTLPRLKPRCFYDLVVEVAIIRPGPIQGDMVHPYLRRRAGEEPVIYPHPTLEPILKRTLGVPLFQEQGMQVAITAAGFSPGEADNLRRAMGHKRSRERMAAICEQLVAGMARNGIPEETGRKIYNQINAFADYGFPESHAASFALLVYASAYLRHYYAPEFLAAMLNAQPMGFYAPGTLIEDAKRHGVAVLPVDLTCSGWDCSLEPGTRGVTGHTPPDAVKAGRGARGVASAPPGPAHPSPPAPLRAASRESQERGDERDTVVRQAHRAPRPTSRRNAPASPPAVRLGLRMIRGLGSKARERLERALAEGPFVSVADVVRRSGLDRRALRLLAEAGAFDTMFPDEPDPRKRRTALWTVLAEQRGDAGPLAPSPPPARRPSSLPSMSPVEITEADYRVTGVSLAGHPMRHLRAMMRENGVRTARDLMRARDGERVGAAGLVICRQRPGTARGFVFLTLEDETGMVNVVVTPKRFEQQALLISTAPLLLVRGTLQVEGRVVNLRGERFHELRAGAGEEWAEGHDFH